MLEIGIRHTQMEIRFFEKDRLLNDNWFACCFIELWLYLFFFLNWLLLVSQEIFTGFTLFFLTSAFTFSFSLFLTFC